MKINILTIFPEMFRPLRESMLGRAEENGIIEFNIVDVRDFSLDKHKKTDDYPFGGGQGMVFMPQPAFDALKSVGAEKTRNIYMSPRGRVLDMELALELADYLRGGNGAEDVAEGEACKVASTALRKASRDLTIFCGHYEGIDQRIIDDWKMEEVSIGDYILTGGEPAAIVFVDAVARLLPGVLASEEAAYEESIYSGLLEAPQYTKPREYRGMQVPEVLVGGNHKNIHLWQFEQALRLTAERRPDLLERFINQDRKLSKEEKKIMDNVLKLL